MADGKLRRLKGFLQEFGAVVLGLLTVVGAVVAIYLAAQREGPPGPKGEPGSAGKDGAGVEVGSIVASALTPVEFADAVGDPAPDVTNQVFAVREGARWAYANGQEIPRWSKYHQVVSRNVDSRVPQVHGNLPDLRGQFMRGIGVGPGSYPDAGRLIGDAQGELIQRHGHNLSRGSVLIDEWRLRPPHWGAPQTEVTIVDNRVVEPVTRLGVSQASLTLDEYPPPKQPAETRPTNVAVYFYIRIN